MAKWSSRSCEAALRPPIMTRKILITYYPQVLRSESRDCVLYISNDDVHLLAWVLGVKIKLPHPLLVAATAGTPSTLIITLQLHFSLAYLGSPCNKFSTSLHLECTTALTDRDAGRRIILRVLSLRSYLDRLCWRDLASCFDIMSSTASRLFKRRRMSSQSAQQQPLPGEDETSAIAADSSTSNSKSSIRQTTLPRARANSLTSQPGSSLPSRSYIHNVSHGGTQGKLFIPIDPLLRDSASVY